MRTYSKTKHPFTLVTILMVCLTACSTMMLGQFPLPPNSMYRESIELKGISIVAQPILTQEESEEYFGVDLIKSGILAVHLSINNNIPDTSFILFADSVHVAVATGNSVIGSPERGDEEIGEAAMVVGAMLISPVLLAVAVQQLSDATIIKENFDRKKIKTTTIEFGENVHGFSYFPIGILNNREVINVCFKLIDSVNDKPIPICIVTNLEK